MRMCGYADVATGKMWRKMRINVRILPAHALSVTGKLKPFMELFANRLRSFNGEFMHV